VAQTDSFDVINYNNIKASKNHTETKKTTITSFMKRKIWRLMYTMKKIDDHGLLSYAGIITSGKLQNIQATI